MDCSPPGSSVHGTLQARILEWVAIHSLLQRTFPNQGSNPGLLHCKQLPYRLSYRGWGGYSLEDKQHYAFHFACALMFRHASNWSVSQSPGLGTCFFSFNLITPLGHLFRFRTRTPGSITLLYHDLFNLVSSINDHLNHLFFPYYYKCSSIKKKLFETKTVCSHFFFSLRCFLVCGILVTPPGIEPVPPAGEVQDPNHWTTRLFPTCAF